MHAGKKVVKHTLFFLLGASGDEESPNSGGAVARRRDAPPPRPGTPSQGEVCLHEITRSNHTDREQSGK
eukprot:scaffold34669_cov62-Phaeocystis_antarctica.AAC.1